LPELLEPRGPFSLEYAARALERFAPAAHAGPPDPGHLHLAFVPDGSPAAAGACVRREDGDLVLESFGAADPAATREQVERVLSLDVDAAAFAAVGRGDPVVGSLQARYPGMRPVSFLSPFEAGVWFLLVQRIRMRQAAALKARLRDALGERVDVHGDERVAFPAPARIAALDAFAGIPDVKLERVRALAAAALEGRLDGARLRAVAPERAAEELRSLPGVGPFTADGIVIRGAGAPDHLALGEPRLGQAVALAYGLDAAPGPERIAELAEGWRPFRSWVAVLLRTLLEDERRTDGVA
jgi:DNA-3-methyladenine glycosylase II